MEATNPTPAPIHPTGGPNTSREALALYGALLARLANDLTVLGYDPLKDNFAGAHKALLRSLESYDETLIGEAVRLWAGEQTED